jgi:hypothetical protein
MWRTFRRARQVLKRFGGMRPRLGCRRQPDSVLADVGFRLRAREMRLRRKSSSVAGSGRRVVVTARPEDPGATIEPRKKSVRRNGSAVRKCRPRGGPNAWWRRNGSSMSLSFLKAQNVYGNYLHRLSDIRGPILVAYWRYLNAARLGGSGSSGRAKVRDGDYTTRWNPFGGLANP